MRGGVTLQRRLSLAGRKPRISPDFVDRRDGVIQSMRSREISRHCKGQYEALLYIMRSRSLEARFNIQM